MTEPAAFPECLLVLMLCPGGHLLHLSSSERWFHYPCCHYACCGPSSGPAGSQSLLEFYPSPMPTPFITQDQRSLQGADWPKCDNCLWKSPSILAWATRQTAAVLTETEGTAVGSAGEKTFSEEDKEFVLDMLHLRSQWDIQVQPDIWMSRRYLRV